MDVHDIQCNMSSMIPYLSTPCHSISAVVQERGNAWQLTEMFSSPRTRAGMQGGKIGRYIAFDAELDMSAYLSTKGGKNRAECLFDLYGVLVHRGSSAQVGSCPK
jgi:hypothetical protein